MISKKLKNDLVERKMIEEDLCFNFKNRQFSIFTRIISPIVNLIKNRAKGQFLSYVNNSIYIFSAKGVIEAIKVEPTLVEQIKQEDISEITTKNVYLNGVRALQFVIVYKNGALKGIIDNIYNNKVFYAIKEKLGK